MVVRSLYAGSDACNLVPGSSIVYIIHVREIRCSSCRASLREGAAFCSTCGAVQTAPAELVDPTAPPGDPPRPAGNAVGIPTPRDPASPIEVALAIDHTTLRHLAIHV